ncbi:adhesion G protein-coupled receptor E2-like [Haliotis rufescens]|uniref:adhesion G protein-coupled receptor E2-like n=1 Tax=Haliotis rufescens TaxID=6454 RepID=UPI00201E7F8D|nr:adhesion G protein-coupled receptor E2-like [Haliotis rufescens]
MTENSYARIKNADNLVVDEVHLHFTLLLMPNYTLESSRERLAALHNVTLNMTVAGTTLEVEIQPVTTHRNVQDKLMLPPTMFLQMLHSSMHLDMSLSINVPLAFNMTCSMAEFGSREVIRVNQSVFIHGDIELNEHEYFTIKHGTYIICLDAVFRRRKEMVVQMPAYIAPAFLASKITTAVCLSLSILFLLLTLLVYILIKELHTVPGLNLILLSSSLFLAHVFYLFGAGTVTTPTICTVIGVLLHYFWLASFAWMNVCCLHMFRVFTNLFSSLHFADNKESLMIKYSVFAYGVPLVIVTMTLTITYIQSGNTTVGYGGPALCFVAPGLVSLVSFGGPASLTLVINGVLFLWTMISIRRRNTQSESLGKKQANDVITFFKLSTITGLSWLFGFVGYFLQRVELMYVFTVLTAGQGVFIFLSFVVSRRILKLIRDHLRCLWAKKEKGHVNTTEESAATGASMTNSYQGKETRMYY